MEAQAEAVVAEAAAITQDDASTAQVFFFFFCCCVVFFCVSKIQFSLWWLYLQLCSPNAPSRLVFSSGAAAWGGNKSLPFGVFTGML